DTMGAPTAGMAALVIQRRGQGMLGFPLQTVRACHCALRRLLLALTLTLMTSGALAATPSLQLSGVDGEPRDNIMAHVAIGNEPCELASWRERAMQRNARRNADTALRALGYYSPTLTTRLQRTDNCWTLDMQVTTGPRVTVSEVQMTVTGPAESDPAFREV